MMNLRQIEVFHAVYQSGSVSGAARALNVSQPSVSKVLRHAESRIGFALFRLVKGRLVPTDEAHTLFLEARELRARIDSLQQTAVNLRRGTEGRLSLAVLPSLGLDVAPAAIARFRAAHPDVSVEIRTLHNQEVLNSLYERESDLAISYDPPRHPRLAQIAIGRGELVLLFRRADLPDAPESVTLEMINHLDLIQLAGTGSIGSLFAHEVDGDEPQRAAITVETYYVAAGLVRHGAGAALVDEFTARANLTPQLVFRPLAGGAAFEIFCMHLEDRPLSRLQRRFVKMLEEIIAERTGAARA